MRTPSLRRRLRVRPCASVCRLARRCARSVRTAAA